MSDSYPLDYKDPQDLVEVVNMIREAAEIHAGFLGNCDIALAMEYVADHIESAQERLWDPKTIMHSFDDKALNDEGYGLSFDNVA